MNEVSEAVKTLTDELKKDPGFRETYKANIAMAFYDEYQNQSSRFVPHNLNKICNDAADRFLENWCNDGSKEKETKMTVEMTEKNKKMMEYMAAWCNIHNIDRCWVAKDQNESVWIYSEEPIKGVSGYDPGGGILNTKIGENLLDGPWDTAVLKYEPERVFEEGAYYWVKMPDGREVVVLLDGEHVHLGYDCSTVEDLKSMNAIIGEKVPPGKFE